jgi:anhydro-N-acetylmuramic acid kinase
MADYYVGLMSGTSMDGIDAVLVEFTDAGHRLVGVHSLPLEPTLRKALADLATPGRGELDLAGRLDHELGTLFSEAVEQLLDRCGFEPGAVTAIGSHGQTVRHRPEGEHPFSLQIGDPNVIAERTGITTIADFRRRDMAAGGQGAPLVPAFHAAALRDTDEDRAVVNIGGIANLTFLPGDPAEAVTGYDSGPGNGLSDGWAQRHLGTDFDQAGAWAAQGTVDERLLTALLAEEYFARPAPKSTGRELFNREWLDVRLREHGGQPQAQDVQATLVALTAHTIAAALHHSMPSAARLIACGGGVRNPTLMSALAAALGDIPLQTTADYGIDPDWVEAIAFAWLARETHNGRPGNMPSVTGASRPVVLGGIYPGNRY